MNNSLHFLLQLSITHSPFPYSFSEKENLCYIKFYLQIMLIYFQIVISFFHYAIDIFFSFWKLP